MTRKIHTAFAIEVSDKRLIEKLADKFGISQNGVMRMGIRLLAEREGVTSTNQQSAKEKV